LQHALSGDEIERRALSKALLPHVRRFYVGYFDPEAHLPYYRPSSRFWGIDPKLLSANLGRPFRAER
jgi:hypothetical protein